MTKTKNILLKRLLPVLFAFILAFTFCVTPVVNAIAPIALFIGCALFAMLTGTVVGLAAGEAPAAYSDFINLPENIKRVANQGYIQYDSSRQIFYFKQGFQNLTLEEQEILKMCAAALSREDVLEIYFNYHSFTGTLTHEEYQKLVDIGVLEGLSFARCKTLAGNTNASGAPVITIVDPSLQYVPKSDLFDYWYRGWSIVGDEAGKITESFSEWLERAAVGANRLVGRNEAGDREFLIDRLTGGRVNIGGIEFNDINVNIPISKSELMSRSGLVTDSSTRQQVSYLIVPYFYSNGKVYVYNPNSSNKRDVLGIGFYKQYASAYKENVLYSYTTQFSSNIHAPDYDNSLVIQKELLPSSYAGSSTPHSMYFELTTCYYQNNYPALVIGERNFLDPDTGTIFNKQGNRVDRRDLGNPPIRFFEVPSNFYSNTGFTFLDFYNNWSGIDNGIKVSVTETVSTTVTVPKTHAEDIIDKGIKTGLIPNNPPIDLTGNEMKVNGIPLPDLQILVNIGNPAIPDVNNPAIPVPGNPSIPDIDLDLPTVWDKFPFSLPFDLYRAITILSAPPVTPKFEIPISNISAGDYKVGEDWYSGGRKKMFAFDHRIVIDMEDFDLISKISRPLLYIAFVIGLIIITNRLIGRG